MRRISFLAAMAVTVIASPVWARCNQPYAPVVKVSASTTTADMASLRSDLTSFMAASDVYQSCLVAANGNSDLIRANQLAKERVGREFNTALHAFKAAHPG